MLELIKAVVDSGYVVKILPEDEDGDYTTQIIDPNDGDANEHIAYDQYIDEAFTRSTAHFIRTLARKAKANV